MTNSSKDNNSVSTMVGASSVNGKDIVTITANPANNGLSVDNNTTGSDNGNNSGSGARDANSIVALIAVSSVTATVNGVNYIQGVTPVEVYVDAATGKLFINSN